MVLLFIFLASTMLPSINIVKAQEDTWTTLAPMPTPKSGLGAVTVNGKIYTIGSGTINQEYDPATNIWTTKAPMPTSRAHFGIATIQNKIYVIGGLQEGVVLSINEEYDPTTNTWTTKASMPTARGQTSASVLNNKIYVTGGIEYANSVLKASNKNEVYDPFADAWTTKSELAYSVEVDHTSAGIGDKLYVIGGVQHVIGGSQLQIYDTKSDTWSQGSQPLKGQVNAASGVITDSLGRELIINLGGGSELSINGINQLYYPQSDTWLSGATMPTTRKNLAVAVVDNYVYAIGGSVETGSHSIYDYFKPTATVERYTPLLTYSSLPTPKPTPMSTLTPTPTSIPTPTIEPTATPTSTPEPTDVEFPVFIVASIIIIAVVSIVILVYGAKTKRRS